jgi:hypothetical protein
VSLVYVTGSLLIDWHTNILLMDKCVGFVNIIICYLNVGIHLEAHHQEYWYM